MTASQLSISDTSVRLIAPQRIATALALALPLLFLVSLGPPGIGPLVAATAAATLAGWVMRSVLHRIPRGTTVSTPWCTIPLLALWIPTTHQWTTGALPTWWLPAAATFTWFATALTITDLRHRRLPDALTLPLYPATAAALLAATTTGAPTATLWNALIGAALFACPHLIVHCLKPSAIGAGDVKLTPPLGALLGAIDLALLPPTLIIAAVLTVTLWLAAPPQTKTTWRTGIPHGPALLTATTLFVVFPPF